MPLAGSCSAVISAACHPPSGSIDTTLSRVMWEEIDHGGLDGVGADARQYSFI